MQTQEIRTALDWIDAHEALLANTHREIWALAELGLQERRTSKLVADILEREGFTVERGVAGIVGL